MGRALTETSGIFANRSGNPLRAVSEQESA